MKEQLYKWLVETINGKLVWRFNDSLGWYQNVDRMGSQYSLRFGCSSEKDVFLAVYGKEQEIIYDGDTALIQDAEEQELLLALMKVVNILYRNPESDKEAIFYE